MVKKEHTTPGQSDVWSRRTTGVAYFCRFGEGATGSAQLQVKLAGEWLPADAAVTATMSAVKYIDEPLQFRWNVTAVSGGTIETFLG